MPLRRYLTLLIVLCTLPLFLLGAALTLVEWRDFNRHQHDHARGALETTAEGLAEHLEARWMALHWLAARPLAQDAAQREQLYTNARAFLSIYGNHLAVTDPAGREMWLNTRVPYGTPMPALSAPPGDARARRAIASGQPAVGDLFEGPLSHRKGVALFAPIWRDGQIIATLVASLETPVLEALLRKAPLAPGQTLKLRDGQGMLMAQHGEPAAGAALWSVQRPLRNAGHWTLELTQHRHDLSPNVGVALMLLATLGLCLLASTQGGAWAARRLMRAVDRLQPGNPGRPQAVVVGKMPGGVGAVPRIAEFDHLAAVLEADLQERDRLLRSLRTAREAERQRIARDLHDDLQQTLGLLRIELAGHGPPRGNLAPGKAAVESSKEEFLAGTLAEKGSDRGLPSAHALNLVDAALQSTRRIVDDLRPPLLEQFGLPEALRQLVQRFAAAHDLAADLEVEPGDPAHHPNLPSEAADAAYRIAQEALNNVAKHAGADYVEIHLDLVDAAQLHLRIEDDGHGWLEVMPLDDKRAVPTAPRGLSGMGERATLLGGKVEFGRSALGGAKIDVTIPL